MYVIIGLGNPGSRYRLTRHNIGFMVLEKMAELHQVDLKQKSFNAIWGKGKLAGVDALLAMPQTYMNLSGTTVRQLLAFFKKDINNLLVVHDDLDLAFGSVRLKLGGGNAGHKGLASITESLGSSGFMRIRLGIGKPTEKSRTESYVLEKFSSEESAALSDVIQTAAEAAEDIIRAGIEKAMAKYHRRNTSNSLKKEDK